MAGGIEEDAAVTAERRMINQTNPHRADAVPLRGLPLPSFVQEAVHSFSISILLVHHVDPGKALVSFVPNPVVATNGTHMSAFDTVVEQSAYLTVARADAISGRGAFAWGKGLWRAEPQARESLAPPNSKTNGPTGNAGSRRPRPRPARRA